MITPRLVIFAGPNGSGKSTLTRQLIERDLLPSEHIDPDRIAQETGGRSKAAAPKALLEAARLRERYLREGRDFCFETVLSHPRWLDFMRRARNMGFEVLVYWIGIGDPHENIARVRIRVAQGGHAIPDHIVLQRWTRSMELLSSVARTADRMLIFDNGSHEADAAIRPIAATSMAGGAYREEIFPAAPSWVARFLGYPPIAVTGDDWVPQPPPSR